MSENSWILALSRCRALGMFLILTSSCAWLDAADFLVTSSSPGRYGGDLAVAERSEPKTLNPVMAIDSISREVTGLINADLIHINRESQRTEPALARSVERSADGRRFVIHLRQGLRFSDGYPFDADDVLFTFQVLLDGSVHAPQRDLLIIDGKPLSVSKKDAYTVLFEFSEPYGPQERLFDSIAILPRHLLLQPYSTGKLAKAWGLNATAGEIAGLGPFRFRQYVPGQLLVLEKNPYYWKQDSAGQRLPYLNRMLFEFAASEDGEVLKFQSGGADLISRISPRNFDVLSQNARGVRTLIDAGASLEYNFLFFNLNNLSGKHLPQIEAMQGWFKDVNFRRAISASIDRAAIARLVYAGRAAPIWTSVTPANKLWYSNIDAAPRSIERARQQLSSAGFSWDPNHRLIDHTGRPVEFSIMTNAGNTERSAMATMIQQDLEQIGVTARVVTLEFRSMLDRVMSTFDYEACLLGLASGDADPGSEMSVLPSDGSTHFWDLSRPEPQPFWQTEIDRLMSSQMRSIDPAARKHQYDRVQQLIVENLPMIPLVSPHVLVAAKTGLGNFRPALLQPYVLWDTEELYWNTY
jgi:peptide/nickel transport system substrate-binding protein